MSYDEKEEAMASPLTILRQLIIHTRFMGAPTLCFNEYEGETRFLDPEAEEMTRDFPRDVSVNVGKYFYHLISLRNTRAPTG